MNATDFINQFSTSPFMAEYSQGAIINHTRRIQKFLAPIVDVADLSGRFKKHSKDRRLELPETVRQLGGRASNVSIEVLDGTYSCKVHALDHTLDASTTALEWLVADAFDFLLGICSQKSELETIQTALTGAGAGSGSVWGSDVDPVQAIDTAILALILSAKCDSIGVAFGSSAWDMFKNHPKVVARVKGDLSWEALPNLFHTAAQFQPSYAFYDTTPNAASETISFMFPTNAVLIFARSEKPNRRDASFMKTFTRIGQQFKLVPSTDNRFVTAQFDWAQDIQVTNTAGVTRLNVSLS